MESGPTKQSPLMIVLYCTLASFFTAVLLFGAYYYFNIHERTISFEEAQRSIDDTRQSLKDSNWEDAVAKAEEGLKHKTKTEEDVDLLIALARSYLLLGNETYKEELNAENALSVIEEILILQPDLAEGYRLQGYAYEIISKFDLARQSYETALLYDPSFALVYAHLGHIESLLGNIDEAYLLYEKSLYLDKGIELAQFGIANILFRERRYDEAEEIIRSIQTFSETKVAYSEASMLLGFINLEKGLYDDAIEHLNQAVERYQYNAQAYAGLSTAYIAKVVTSNDVDVALKTYEENIDNSIDRALSIHPQNTYALINKGNIYTLKDDCELATDYYRQARNTVPVDITLGVSEKAKTNQYITNALNNCAT